MLNNYHRFCGNPWVETLHSTSRQMGFRRKRWHLKVSRDEAILETIQDLDRQMNTENYLPIFHLRQS